MTSSIDGSDTINTNTTTSPTTISPTTAPSILPQQDALVLTSTKPILYRLYTSHILSTWNSRAFEFGAVIFLAAIFPGTLFYASCYALFRSFVAALGGSWIGNVVDQRNRLDVVRQSIVWQRLSVAGSCLALLGMLQLKAEDSEKAALLKYALFGLSVVLACVEKLAYMANTVAVERDWVVVVSDSLSTDRQELNSTMRRIDLLCKLLAPVGIALLDGYSTSLAIWVTFSQNALSVGIEYFAIKHVYDSVPALSNRPPDPSTPIPTTTTTLTTKGTGFIAPWLSYAQNPAFLPSLSLSLLYLTVLSFASQMTTYLLTLGFTSTHVSLMRLVSVFLELSATCAAPWLMARIGAVRSGLWFVNEQLLSIALAVGGFLMYTDRPMLAGLTLVAGVILSRIGLWGFDLSVQFLVQDSTPEQTRGSFSAVEMSLQNVFELLSFLTTMVFYRPEDFKYPVYISAAAVAASAACFAGYVRRERGHLVHADRCLKRWGKGKVRYRVLPTIEEEVEMNDRDGSGSGQ